MEGSSATIVKQWRLDYQPGARQRRGVRWRRLRISGLLVAAAVMLAAMGVMLSWLQLAPNPHFVSLRVHQYEAEELAPLYLAENATHQRGRLDKGTILAELKKLRQRAASESVVIYLSGHAIRGSSGQVIFLPADAAPDAENPGIPLQSILAKIKACPSRHKLLVLDIMRPRADVHAQVMADDVADAIEGELIEVPDRDRLVLCASGAGQTSLHSAELGKSIFAHYFEQGLLGDADGWLDAQPDGIVTAKELAAFTAANVRTWAETNRAARQAPVLFGRGADFALAAAGERLAARGAVAGNYPAWLATAWQQRDQRLRDGSCHRLPHLFQQQQMLLIAAERQCAGAAKEVQLQFRERLEKIDRKFAAMAALVEAPPTSLAEAAAQGNTVESEATLALLQRLYDVQLEAPLASSQAEFQERIRGVTDYSLAAAVFEQALSGDASPGQLRLLDSLLVRPGKPQPQFVEALLLRQLAHLTTQVDAGNWPIETVRLALQLCARCQELTSVPRRFAWLEPLISKVAQLRHDGEIALFAHGYARPAIAHTLLDKANTLCNEVLRLAARLESVESVYDQSLMLLPVLTRYLEHAPELQGVWEEAVVATQQLGDILQGKRAELEKTPPPDVLAATLSELEKDCGKLRSLLEQLNAPFRTERLAELRSSSEAATADAAVYQMLEAVLATPHPQVSANERIALWHAARRLGERLQQQTPVADRVRTARPEPDDDQPGTDLDTAFRRARMAIALLELGGVPTTKVRALVGSLQGVDHERGPGWHAFGLGLRKLWQEHAAEAAIAALWASPFAHSTGRVESCTAMKHCLEQSTRLRSWKAKLYQYLGRDYQGLGITNAIVEAPIHFYSRHVDRTAAGPTFAANAELDLQLASVDLRHSSRPGRLKIKRVRQEGTTTEFAFEVVDQDGAWFDITPRGFELPAMAAGVPMSDDEVALQVSMNVAPGRRPPPAAGFLIRINYAGRHFHHAVEAPLAVRDKPRLVLSPDPDMPTAPLSEIRITPGAAVSECFAFVHNPVSSARRALLEIANGTTVIHSSAVEMDAFELKKLALRLDRRSSPFAGPLCLRVVDLTSKEILDSCELSIVVDSRINADAPPRLQLTAPTPRRGDNMLSLGVKTDNVPDTAALEVLLEKSSDLAIETEVIQRMPRAQNVRIEAAATARGGLAFNASVSDWAVDLNIGKLAGPYTVRARLLDAGGNIIGEVSDKLDIELRTAPQVRIVNAPAKAVKGTALELRALAIDGQSEIDSVEFFIGLPDEGKIPERIPVMPARQIDAQKNVWSASVKMPEDTSGPTPVTVVVTNRVGETSCETINVHVGEKDVERSGLGKVEGKVLENGRPQPGLTVQLLDSQGQAVAETTTAADGSYSFAELRPGSYTLHCFKPASRRRARVHITIDANKKSEAPLSLVL